MPTKIVFAMTLACSVLSAACGSTAAPDDFGQTQESLTSRHRSVPGNYPTVQAAIDAANPGDTIDVRPGTYVGQLSIGKDLVLRGAGAGLTVVRAPAVLAESVLDRPALIEIHGGARVKISRLTVSGPGPTSCEVRSLGSGIRVIEDASLDLSDASVLDIHDSPKHECDHNGIAISVGDFRTNEIGHARIRNVVVQGFQNAGIFITNPRSDAVVTDSVVDAKAVSGEMVAPSGIEVGNGAVGKISRNVVRGSRCSSPEFGCGADPIDEIQAAGLTNGPGEPPASGTEFDHNFVAESDIGLYVLFAPDCCSIHDNVFVNNRYFGIAIQDSVNEVSSNLIVGGDVGVAAVADSVDTVATLHGGNIFASRTRKTAEIACCGFSATVDLK